MTHEAATDLARTIARWPRFSPVMVEPIKPHWKRYHVVTWDDARKDTRIFRGWYEWMNWLAGYGD